MHLSLFRNITQSNQIPKSNCYQSYNLTWFRKFYFYRLVNRMRYEPVKKISTQKYMQYDANSIDDKNGCWGYVFIFNWKEMNNFYL